MDKRNNARIFSKFSTGVNSRLVWHQSALILHCIRSEALAPTLQRQDNLRRARLLGLLAGGLPHSVDGAGNGGNGGKTDLAAG